MKTQTSTEVSQEQFKKISKVHPDAVRDILGEWVTLTLPNGVMYYTSIHGLING